MEAEEERKKQEIKNTLVVIAPISILELDHKKHNNITAGTNLAICSRPTAIIRQASGYFYSSTHRMLSGVRFSLQSSFLPAIYPGHQVLPPITQQIVRYSSTTPTPPMSCSSNSATADVVNVAPSSASGMHNTNGSYINTLLRQGTCTTTL